MSYESENTTPPFTRFVSFNLMPPALQYLNLKPKFKIWLANTLWYVCVAKLDIVCIRDRYLHLILSTFLDKSFSGSQPIKLSNWNSQILSLVCIDAIRKCAKLDEDWKKNLFYYLFNCSIIVHIFRKIKMKLFQQP